MTNSQPDVLPWRWLGRLDYRTGTAQQREHRDRLVSGDERAAVVLLLEHEPVITLGRNANPDHLLAPSAELVRRGVAVERTDRGGDVTYHGPGQLMIYPVVRLRTRLRDFLEAIATVLADVATQLAVPDARWRCNPAGLWLADHRGERKLAACGLHLKRFVCTHGFAFNVATPVDVWQLIVPCGLTATGVTSLAEERAQHGLAPPAVADVAQLVGPRLARVLYQHHRSV